MEIIPDKRGLVGLVEQAAEGKICLPNFQRDFVWPRESVADLVRSVLRGYFVGSLLMLRSDPQSPPFSPIALTGASPRARRPEPNYLLLDGQQRLTALLYALTAPDLGLKDSKLRRWFFVSLDLLDSEPDNDGIVFDRTKRELNGLDQQAMQFRDRILPCTSLIRSNLFLKWRDACDDWLRDEEPENHVRFREDWRDSWVNAFQSFQVPVIELPEVKEEDPDSIGRVCAIFEKLNSTGVDLSVYDLLTARLYRSEIRLHDLWDESCKRHKRLATWSGSRADKDKFGVLVLRTLALLRDLEAKPKTLINLKPQGFPDDWNKAAGAFDRALELVEHVGADGFGVFEEKWIPGFGLIPVLAALRANIEDQGLGEKERSDLRRWYWCNVFLERFSSGVESKSKKDYSEMLAYWSRGASEPDVFREATQRIGAPGFEIRRSASQSGAIYSGIFCMLANRGAKDWRRGESIQLQELQDHHIFPRDYLRRHGIQEKADVNSIVNRTLISDETNNKIKAKAPADYLGSAEIFPGGPKHELMDPHFIDLDALGAMRDASEELSSEAVRAAYQRFCDEREELIVTEIRSLCGVPEPESQARGSSVESE